MKESSEVSAVIRWSMERVNVESVTTARNNASGKEHKNILVTFAFPPSMNTFSRVDLVRCHKSCIYQRSSNFKPQQARLVKDCKTFVG